MGFLDTLKDIGLGNTGPRGQMDSGATNYAQYAQQRSGFESERGVTQDLAMAAKEATSNNTEISGKTFIDIATKYKVPLNYVIKRGTPINEQIFGEVTKGKMKAAFEIDAENKRLDPNLVRDEKYIEKVINQVGGMDYRQRDILYRAVSQMVGQKKFIANVDPTKDVLGITGNITPTIDVAISGKPGPPEETKAQTRAANLKDAKALATHKQDIKTPGETPPQKREADNAASLALMKAKAKWKNKNPDTLSINDRRILDKELVTMAITIESEPTGPGAKQAAEFFNDYADGDVVYLWKKTKRNFLGDKEETVKIDLPVFDGKQVTADDIRVTLADPKNKGKTLEDILRGLGAIE